MNWLSRCQIVALPFMFEYPVWGQTAPMRAANADMDSGADHLNIVKVLRAGNNLARQPATWGVRISIGVWFLLFLCPPTTPRCTATIPGDGVLGDERVSLVYNPETGELGVDSLESQTLTSSYITSEGCLFNPEIHWGLFDVPGCVVTTWGHVPSSFGELLPTELTQDALRSDLTAIISVIGEAGAPEVDLVFLTPFEIEFVSIGNPGNPPDTTGNPNPAGSVDYVYRIGKYEISRDMIGRANYLGGLGITLLDMSSVNGNGPNKPATVSWNEAARFVNWLNTSNAYPPAYKFAKQPGDVGYNARAFIELWAAGDEGFNADNPFRNRQAHFFLPSVDEWYKAAYYDPNANGGAGGYWDFPTGSDSEPTPVVSGTDADTAVYVEGTEQSPAKGPADITQAGGLSPYGVMGLGGNVSEWEETEFDLMNDNGSSRRGVRGGDWVIHPLLFNGLSATTRAYGNRVQGSTTHTGFRVAAVSLRELRPGDADQNSQFDQLDLQQVLRRAKYLTGEPATWGDGDWDGAPGGYPGEPPQGNGLFGQMDIVAALQTGNYVPPVSVLPRLDAGDADQDLDCDQLDLVQVLQRAKYLTGEPATWGDGDWNGAPGGRQGNPPKGDGLFNQIDIIAALGGCKYLTGPYAALAGPGAQGDEQTSLAYDARTGELSIEPPVGNEFTSFNITSAGGKFIGDKSPNSGGFAHDNIFWALFGPSRGRTSFGPVLPAGLTEEEVAADLSAVGSLSGGGDLGAVDLVYIPEPSAIVLLCVAVAVVTAPQRIVRMLKSGG